ncbi:hypothetical protein GBAR_LOCUS4393 [Geodia barretti]|uniref:Uncharacterized protein n=1 Tax=Geodia barretti TaxID=519541 RepID=A0AA35W2K5_GEOBA|nr:hypothetical protein GBAR_LOCUS4393 [Geodia barretti]
MFQKGTGFNATKLNPKTHRLSISHSVRPPQPASTVSEFAMMARGYSDGAAQEKTPPTLVRRKSKPKKKKTCCRGWFCNKDVPTDWVKGNENENETTPTMTLPTEATPTNSTRPPPAEISTGSPTTEEETPSNCTLAEGGMSSDIKPCAGPGSVIELTPEKVEPITTEIGDSWNFFCYCTTCPDSYILCGSHFGCATLYGYDISVSTGGPSIVTSHFCLSRDDFVSCGQTPGVVCCLSNFCNAPHSLNLTEALPTGSPTEPIMAEITYPIEIPSVTEGSPTNQNTVNPSTTTTPHVPVNPLSPPTLVNSSGTEFEQSNEEDEDLSSLFYAMSAVLAVLVAALVLVMVVLIFCCYSYNKKKQSSSPRRPQITTATRESIVPVTGRSNFVIVKVEDRELCSRIESSKVEHSCTTESTCTQPSSPESTV